VQVGQVGVHLGTDTHGRRGGGATETRKLSHARELSCPNYLLDGSLHHLGRDGASTRACPYLRVHGNLIICSKFSSSRELLAALLSRIVERRRSGADSPSRNYPECPRVHARHAEEWKN